MELDLDDFVRRLDAGEFDGNLDKALGQLEVHQLRFVADYLDRQAQKRRADKGKPPHDPEREV